VVDLSFSSLMCAPTSIEFISTLHLLSALHFNNQHTHELRNVEIDISSLIYNDNLLHDQVVHVILILDNDGEYQILNPDDRVIIGQTYFFIHAKSSFLKL
jgi:hypothetical protein